MAETDKDDLIRIAYAVLLENICIATVAVIFSMVGIRINLKHRLAHVQAASSAVNVYATRSAPRFGRCSLLATTPALLPPKTQRWPRKCAKRLIPWPGVRRTAGVWALWSRCLPTSQRIKAWAGLPFAEKKKLPFNGCATAWCTILGRSRDMVS